MNRNVWLLFACQALMNAVMAGQVVMASLVGHALAVDKALNTLPMGIQMVGVMAASIPAGIVFARVGRKPGFWMGCVLSILGSLTFALAVWRGDFALYCFAALLAGLGFGISQHLRFAAAEVAAPDSRARAISLVLAGGVVAALIGPEIVKRTNGLIHISGLTDGRFLATYLCLPVLPILTAILLLFVRVPPLPERRRVSVPFRAIVARPSFITAAVAAMVGYGTMNLVMASTPLQMLLCGFGVNASADVIRAHSIAMFLPGFVTGRLIQRFGVHQIICAGALITTLCVAVNIAYAPVMATFMVALIVLGIGWNFMFVGGTTLLATAYEPHERVRVQATNDFIVFGTVALTAFGSGAIHATLGWDALNLSVLPPVVIALVLVTWHWLARERPATAAV
jgi:MFS family permease